MADTATLTPTAPVAEAPEHDRASPVVASPRSPCTSSPFARARAIIVIPLTFSVLGGFRSNQQLVEQPGRPARPVGVRRTTPSILRTGSFWRQVWNSTLIALLTTAFVLPGGVAGGVRASPATRSEVASWCTGCSRSGCCSRSRSRSCRCSSRCARSGLLSNPARRRAPAGGVRTAASRSSSCARSSGRSRRNSRTRRRSTAAGRSASTGRHAAAVAAGAQHGRRAHRSSASWNAFFLPLLVLIDPDEHTLPIGVNNISSQYSTDFALRARLHDAVDDPGADLLRARRASDHRWPDRRRGQGLTVHDHLDRKPHRDMTAIADTDAVFRDPTRPRSPTVSPTSSTG